MANRKTTLRGLDAAQVRKNGRGTPADPITQHLRELERSTRKGIETESVVLAFVPAICALAEAGYLVSVSLTAAGDSVRIACRVDGEWCEWYAAEDEWAAEVGGAIVRLFEGGAAAD